MSLARDVFLPPIPIGVDFMGLGLPRGPILGVVALGVSIFVLVQLRRRKVHGCLALLAAGLLFAFADCGAWMVNMNERADRRHRRIEEWQRQKEAEDAAKSAAPAVPSASAAPSASSPQ